MSEQTYDAIIIGSGAGGSAAAYSMVKAGKRVLLLEKGRYLPRDDSTLDVTQVFKLGRFKNQQAWLDRHNNRLVPEEYYNVGGKTKWYGAALLRFSAHEFEPDTGFDCPGWPVSYSELEPWYTKAESLLGVRHFENEPGLKKLIDRLVATNTGWRVESLPLALKPDIIQHQTEAKHFDGFASPGAYKADAEFSLLNPIQDEPNFSLQPHKEVTELLFDNNSPARLAGVVCADGSHYRANTIVLAAGAMASPRLLQTCLKHTGLFNTLSSARLVGANFKQHFNSALLAISAAKNQDVLRKTAIFFNQAYPHSTVQCLGWIDGDMLATQLPVLVPKFIANILGARVRGFFVTTEDGTASDNRILAADKEGDPPVINYDQERTPASVAEHRAITRAFSAMLLRLGIPSVSKPMGITATAHALGSMMMGHDPEHSVVDANGKVHGIDNLYVADGSVLPRSSRVNPALTIYAWGLRLGQHLADKPETTQQTYEVLPNRSTSA